MRLCNPPSFPLFLNNGVKLSKGLFLLLLVIATPACLSTYDPEDEVLSLAPIEPVTSVEPSATTPNSLTSLTLEQTPVSLSSPEPEIKATLDTQATIAVGAPLLEEEPIENTTDIEVSERIFASEQTTAVDFNRPIQIEDRIVSVEGNRLTTRLGIVVPVTEETDLKTPIDDATATEERLLAQLGESIQAQGWFDGQHMIWTQVILGKTDRLRCRLQAIVTNINRDQHTFDLLQTTVNTQLTRENYFLDGIGDLVFRVGRGVLFDVLTRITEPQGFLVQAISDDSGDGCVDGYLTAEEVALEAICTSRQHTCR